MDQEKNSTEHLADFVVTRDWLHRCATNYGGWTRAQLAVLGVSWPPKKGWLMRIVGLKISADQKRRFERRERQMPLEELTPIRMEDIHGAKETKALDKQKPKR